MSIDWTPLKEIIEQHQTFVLTSHCRADCDAIGSELALAQILQAMGKQVAIVNGDPVPRHIQFLDSDHHVGVLGTSVNPSDVTDRERIEESCQSPILAGLDCLDEFLGRPLSHPLELLKLFGA